MENGGLFVCKPRHLLLVGSKANTKSMPENDFLIFLIFLIIIGRCTS